MTTNQKVHLMRQVYDAVYEGGESFEEQNLGADLAYLLGAILKGSQCEWEHDRPIVSILRYNFKPNRRIWGHIRLVGPE